MICQFSSENKKHDTSISFPMHILISNFSLSNSIFLYDTKIIIPAKRKKFLKTFSNFNSIFHLYDQKLHFESFP